MYQFKRICNRGKKLNDFTVICVNTLLLGVPTILLVAKNKDVRRVVRVEIIKKPPTLPQITLFLRVFRRHETLGPIFHFTLYS